MDESPARKQWYLRADPAGTTTSSKSPAPRLRMQICHHRPMEEKRRGQRVASRSRRRCAKAQQRYIMAAKPTDLLIARYQFSTPPEEHPEQNSIRCTFIRVKRYFPLPERGVQLARHVVEAATADNPVPEWNDLPIKGVGPAAVHVIDCCPLPEASANLPFPTVTPVERHSVATRTSTRRRVPSEYGWLKRVWKKTSAAASGAQHHRYDRGPPSARICGAFGEDIWNQRATATIASAEDRAGGTF